MKLSSPTALGQLLVGSTITMASFCALPAGAQILPTPIRNTHPRILAHQEDFDRLRVQLPIAPSNFPAAGGTISFSFTPRAAAAPSEDTTPIFSDYRSGANHIFVRHVSKYDTAKTVGVQIGLQAKSYDSYVAGDLINLPIDSSTKISISWNSANHTACYSLGGRCFAMSWLTPTGGLPVDWDAGDQDLSFTGRPNEILEKLSIQDLNHNPILDLPTVGDPAINNAWALFTKHVDELSSTLIKCPTVAEPPASPADCDVAKGARATIYENARDLALAYRMTGKKTYQDAAFNYLDKLFKVTPVTAGTEWSMGGRVSALGYLYDWMYADVTQRAVTDDVDHLNYADKIAQTIKLTLAGRSEKQGDDLNTSICGMQPVVYTKVRLDCEKKPVYQNWNRFASTTEPSIEPYYISAHNFSAVSELTVGLLAIASEHPEVIPMIETSYSHFDQGFIPAHAGIAVDGGYPTGYAYGAAGNEFGERLLMWRKALEDRDGPPVFAGDWTSKLVYPFIYSLRQNGGQKPNFPALGDNFEFYATNPMIAEMALSAAVDKGDMMALAFYNQVLGVLRGKNNLDEVMERLFYPATGTPADLLALDKSRLFRQSGQVLMRDSWDYPNATLLEFKSSNFISQNHQHMDQNSISLNYKAPLLLDSGLYESYNSSHWYNYYTRTIAHNSVVVFDPAEHFIIGETEYSNDGGQWYHTKYNIPILYPTPEEIAPGAINYLDGVTLYENAPKYTYTSGNASKAYSIDKLDQNNGFVRSVLFVRGDDPSQKPVTIVFDRVLPKRALTATFLLHTANAPAIAPALNYLADGQYRASFAVGDNRQLTVRNGGGMATVKTLLPLNATIMVVGGRDQGNSCSQTYLSSAGSTTLPAGSSAGDCRFTVRQRQSNGTYLWRNYTAEISTQQKDLADVGSYRIEISSPATPVANQPQYFLHVLSVADNDQRTDIAALDSALRLAADANTEAVLLNDQTIAVFNRDSAPAATLGWRTALRTPSIIATGLKPGKAYALSSVETANGNAFQLVESVDGPNALHSSDQGVININY